MFKLEGKSEKVIFLFICANLLAVSEQDVEFGILLILYMPP